MAMQGDNSQAILAQQLEHDRRMRVVERLHALTADGSKSLAILNGGAAVAVLALVQALVDKPVYAAFKPYAVVGLICFLLGAFLATIPFFFHYAYVAHAYNDTGRQLFWRHAIWYLLISSAVSALGGGAAMALGMISAL